MTIEEYEEIITKHTIEDLHLSRAHEQEMKKALTQLLQTLHKPTALDETSREEIKKVLTKRLRILTKEITLHETHLAYITQHYLLITKPLPSPEELSITLTQIKNTYFKMHITPIKEQIRALNSQLFKVALHDNTMSTTEEERRRRFEFNLGRARETSLAFLLNIPNNKTQIHCPLLTHEDKTPSAKIYNDTHLHCFSCGFHGDQIDVIRKIHPEFSFNEALEFICQ